MNNKENILGDIFDGKRAVKRSDPKPGEKPFFYLRPQGDMVGKTWLSDMETADVDSPDDPNPFLTSKPASMPTSESKWPEVDSDQRPVSLRAEDNNKWHYLKNRLFPSEPEWYSAEALKKMTGIQPLAEKYGERPKYYVNFNGRSVSFPKEDGSIGQIPAMSGQPGYQCKKYMAVKNKGSLPEGMYVIRPDELQRFEDKDPWHRWTYENLGIDWQWPGGLKSWGSRRYWLQPGPANNMLGRSNLSIHGGKELGSAGCIDLAGKMNDFVDWVQKSDQEMIPVYVQYPEECWEK